MAQNAKPLLNTLQDMMGHKRFGLSKKLWIENKPEAAAVKAVNSYTTNTSRTLNEYTSID